MSGPSLTAGQHTLYGQSFSEKFTPHKYLSEEHLYGFWTRNPFLQLCGPDVISRSRLRVLVCGAGSVGRAAQGSTAELRTQLGPRASVSQNSYGPQIPLLLLLSSRLKRLPWNFTPRNLLSEPRVMDARFQKELLCSCPLSTDCFKCQQHHNSPLPQKKIQPMFLNRLDTRGIHYPILHRPLNYPQIIFILNTRSYCQL